MASKPKCPCTRQCEKRSATCRLSCEEYQKYEILRMEYYKDNNAEREAENAIRDSRSRGITHSKMRNFYAKKGGKK